ncbi:MAG: amidohydrolase family protein [Lawsonibacter sp.]|nr:amidohydrolase family protein [Lawsonibacter sp.]
MQTSTLIICGQLYDGVRPQLERGMEILVEGSVITGVGRNLSRPRDCQVIDLGGMTVTPGMIDAHIHSDIFDWRNYSDILMRSEVWNNLGHLHTAQRSLERGFTTIRAHALAQGRGYGLSDVRRAIDEGYFQGSRMVITFHMLGSPGSHADASQAIINPWLSDAASQPFIGSGADFFRQVVRKDIKYGADFIKLFISGGFSTPGDSPENTYLSDGEIEAIITTARSMGRPTTAHVYTPEHMQKLIRFGITGMEHGSLMDEETAALFEKTNTYLVPTFCPYNEIINLDEAALAQKEPHFQAKLRKYAAQLKKGREIIAGSSIRLGYGTDFVTVHQCYESWYEYQSWMRAGIDPFRILKAATSTNAEILGLQDRIGTVEPGKLADLAGWRRDLLGDEDALSECAFVMKGGVRCRALHGGDQ